MKELSVSVCDCRSIQRCLKQERRPSQASTDRGELPGVLVLHVLQLKSPGAAALRRSAASRIVSGKNKNTKATNVNRKHCSQTKNRLNLQESQLKLNCESGITLYIKKEKKKTILLYLLSLFSPSVLIYDLV